jgi:hypothetical protein
LFRSVIGIAVGCLIGFIVANSVVRFFQSPLERAMENYYLATALNDFPRLYGDATYEVKQMILNEKQIPEATQIDAGKLALALQITYPEQFGGIEISPYWYTLGVF